MLLNYGLQQKAPNIVSAPKTYDIDSVLGLTPSSQYSGFKGVGDTGYYYKDNMMYKPYTVQPASSYFFRNTSPYGITYYNSSSSPYGLSSQPQPSIYGGYSGGWQRGTSGGPVEGTIYSGEQAFKPVKNLDITGFRYNSGENTYDPSMAYVYANAPKPTFNPTPNLASFLSAPTAPTYTGNYGAGRYLGGNGLLGLDFGLPSGQSANE
jgi:hypothetical protein